MSQRIALATSILAAAASIAACVMVYFVVNESRTAIQTLVEQGGDKDQAILDRLDELAKKSKNIEFNQAKLRLVQEKSGGPPAAGYKVQFSKYGSDNEEGRISLLSNAEGIVDFGSLQSGKYNLKIWTPAMEYNHAMVYVRAGQPTDLEVICPAAEPPKSKVSFEFDWPVDLRNRGFRIHTFFARTGRKFNGCGWANCRPRYQHLVFLGEDTFVDLTGEEKEGTLSEVAQKLDARVTVRTVQKQVSWDDGHYIMACQLLFGPRHRLRNNETEYSDIESNFWGTEFNTCEENARIEGDGFDPFGYRAFFSVPDSPRAMLLTTQPAMQFTFGVPGAAFRSGEEPLFEVKPGVENVWKISLPEAVIESLRKQLADPKSAPSSVEPKNTEPKLQDAPKEQGTPSL